MLWNRTYGGVDDDSFYSIVQTSDGGYVVAGRTSSFGSGKYDGWLIKTDENGSVLWDRTYGGIEDEHVNSMVNTSARDGLVFTDS
jgi:hypothetical protein